jgi:2-dehydropantoate 2-reductase
VKSPTVLVVGTGAMGCLFAARLAAAGVSVGMLGTWAEAINVLNRDGVHIVDEDGTGRPYPVKASSNPQDFEGVAQALVMVKSWQTERATRQLQVCLDPGGIALTLQNGLGNLEILEETLGAERAAAGTVVQGATLLEPGVVRAWGKAQISLGNHPRIAQWEKLLRKASFEVQVFEDITSILWGKLLVNAAINPLSMLLEVPNEILRSNAHAHDLVVEVVREIQELLQELRIALPYENPLEYVDQVIERTGENLSSMLQDWNRGAPTEIEAITGAVVSYARSAGVSVPVNETLYRLVKARLALTGIINENS